MKLSKSKRLRKIVTDAYAIFSHDPVILTVAVEAMLDELDHAGLPDEQAAALWLEAQCTRVIREVGLEVAQYNGLQLAPVSGEGVRTVRIKRSDVIAARTALARNMARLSVALLWLLPMVACSACGGETLPPADAPAVTLTDAPWCYDSHQEENYRATTLHLGLRADGKTAFRLDVNAGHGESYQLPGRYVQETDGHMKVRVEEPMGAVNWTDVGVKVFTARGAEWVETDARGNMPRCNDGG
jgi:hypothetical protein